MSNVSLPKLERHALASLAFGVIGDAMGTPTELLEPDEIERRFGWVNTFEGDGTDDSIMRDLLAAAIIATGGYASADDWAAEWRQNHATIFGDKVGRFFPSVLHAADKLNRGYPPRTIAAGTMPSSTSAMSISPVGIVNAGHPRAAAAQAMEIASLLHVTDVAFCQDGAAAIAAAVAAALAPGAGVDDVLHAAIENIKPWSGGEMRTLISDSLVLARTSTDYKTFRSAYHQTFRRRIACDSRETVPAALAIVWLAAGDPWEAAVLSANFGRDSDTIACMAAGICGALSGVDSASEAKLGLLPTDCLEAQKRLARELVAVRHAKAEAERRALSNSI
jgi:ADP-ribosylglycohydrolase